ncbi:mannitol dehydrogenase family protein [Martelella sp. HB161492]|uniref:mannitol dehydrogenase family protein n=1 Tax=Martelella sp. HB161492 TaxID=2720726 RepID=UPI0015916BE9|nr:mannitol dehydrogenase family protein [Martelella sp. HB161492]
MTVQKIASDYDRATLVPRILHFGFGAFGRAHPIVYLEDGMNKAGGDFGVIAVRLNSGAEELTALDDADGLYTVAEVDGSGVTARKIGAVIGTCHPRRDGIDTLLGYFAAAKMAIVALTITEKGYCISSGALDLDNKGIRADLETPDQPKTAIGVIVAGLALRRQKGLGGLTILSCDNLPDNGQLAKIAILTFAERLDPALAAWISENCTFPVTMVDRIVPALDEHGRKLIQDLNDGVEDPNGIVCEPFRQWVIEDHFAGDVPPYEASGAMLVDDVTPFEMMKLRMLNGSHTFLAMLGGLAGHETIAACMEDGLFRTAALTLMLAEQRPTLPDLPGVDTNAYATSLIERFSNPELKHRTAQIAWDTSQKLPQRILQSVVIHLERGTDWKLLALTIAGWCHFLEEAADKGAKINDHLADQLLTLAGDYTGAALIERLAAIEQIFPPALATSHAFKQAVLEAYDAITDKGPRGAVEAAL